ncbi:MAG: hypothetical protein HYS13_05365 [Planctomycetia bacterium]|nr:hypothetical protein [Planctomycetia bacterium]
MKFTGRISRLADGRFLAVHESREVGRVEATAATRDEAAEKLRQEIRYRLELCPCSGETYQHIEIEVV